MFAKEKLMSEAVVKVRKILRLMTGSNHKYARTSCMLKVSRRLHTAQIREQMSVPDLHVFTLKFHSNFSPKKNRFFHFFWFKKLKKNFFL